MKNFYFLPLAAAMAFLSCTKDAEYLPGNAGSAMGTRAAAYSTQISELVNQPLHIKTYVQGASGETTCFLSLLYDNSSNTEMLATCKFLPAVTVEPLDTIQHPDWKKRQVWYLRSKNGKYYLESAISFLVTKDNVSNIFGKTDYWDYWNMCYGMIPQGYYGEKDVLYLELTPEDMVPSDRYLSFEKVDHPTKELWRIKTDSDTYPGYYFTYPNPNPGVEGNSIGGGQVKMVKGVPENYYLFEISCAEEMEFMNIEYDLTQAQANFGPETIVIEYFSNSSHTEILKKSVEWEKTTTKSSKWTEDKTTSWKFGADFMSKISVKTPIVIVSNENTLQLTFDYNSSQTSSYGEDQEVTERIKETVEISIDPQQTVKIVKEHADYQASVPYQLRLRGKETGREYIIMGVWNGVNISRNALMMYDITDGENSRLLTNLYDVDGKNVEVYDQAPRLSLTEEKNNPGYYRLYYSFVNPKYVSPKYEMYITKIINGINDWVLYHPEGHYRETSTGRNYYRFRYPEGGTSYRLDVVVSSGDKTTTGSIYVDEAH